MPEARWVGRLRPRDVVPAAAVAVVQLVGSTFAGRHQGGPVPLDPLAYVLLLLGPVLLVGRRHRPELVLGGVMSVTVAYWLLGYPQGPVFLSLVIAFVGCAIRGRRWVTYSFMVSGYVLLVWLGPPARDEGMPSWGSALGTAAWVLVLAAVGEGVRQRRAAVAAARQRELEERRTREEESRRRAADERLDIARELHDVLAHSLSLINVQSGVALELVDQRPEQAREALAAIKTTSREALVEVQAVLASLRRKGEGAPHAPTPGISDLDVLVSRVRAVGLDVTTRVEGQPVPLPHRVDLAAARIVQESLTNVTRHARDASATVVVTYSPNALQITVDDDGRGSAVEGTSPSGSGGTSPSGGNGIPGMRERAAALGGHLDAGPRPGGGFRVRATLPIDDRTVTT